MPRLRRRVLEVKHLRLVEAICQTHSVTAAASLLNLSQSALSHQLLALERDLGAQLFERQGKRMEPTAAGVRLAVSAKRVLSDLEATELALRDLQLDDRQAIQVRVGCSTLYPWLAAEVGRFSAENPDVDVRVAFDRDANDVEALVKREADLVVTVRPSADKRLVSRQLFALETIALLPQGHRLASNPEVRWEDLTGETLLIHEIPEADEVQLRAATAKGGRPAKVCRVQLTEAIRELTRAGQGVGVLSEWPDTASALGPDLLRRPLKPRHVRTFWATWLDGVGSAERFADFLAPPELVLKRA